MTIEQKCDIVIAMLEDMNSNKKQPQINLAKIETLTVMMQSCIDQTADNTAQLKDVIEEVRKPIISERRITIDIISKEVTLLFIAMGLIISVLGSALYFTSRPNYKRNDNAKIRQLRKDVEDYERAVQERAALEEQTRLRQLESEKLEQQAKSIKEK